ncbi:MAG: class I SAM-dependent rRNA methyltransferase [Planctomycetes bacterium]|nr:class I SAM-dependent rRNA methyltransferase [Planctomycetota bacterium]
MARVYVQKGKARPFWFRHPWVFSGAVERVEGHARDGDIVTVLDCAGGFIGAGLYNSRSQIRVRILSHREGEVIDAAFFRTRLERAVALREDVLRLPAAGTTGYRLVHGEGDGLSGLVVERYGDHVVIQLSAAGMKQREGVFLDFLEERLRPRSIYENASFPYREVEGFTEGSGVRRGELPEGEVTFTEHDLELGVDLRRGQKTGYYFDQRDNRMTVARHAAGARVLDAFCYCGGFALQAARAGAREVVAVDSSAAALEAGRRNAARSGLAGRITFEEADVNVFLAQTGAGGRRFDLVVLDPPKFAVARKDRDGALYRYHALNAEALRVVEPGGLIATASCSFHVSEADFDDMLNAAAKKANRFLQILHRAGQAPDHPVSSACLEGRYLKFVLARVW